MTDGVLFGVPDDIQGRHARRVSVSGDIRPLDLTPCAPSCMPGIDSVVRGGVPIEILV